MDTEFEKVLISNYKEEMISYLESHPEAFDEAILLAVSDKQPYSWRSAWLLWSCMKKNDNRLRGHIKDIMKVLETKDDGHQRELLKILLEMELNENQESLLFELCSSVWLDINKTPSVRLTAFKVLIKIVRKYPELKHEILLLAQSRYLESLSPGVKRSIKKMISEFSPE